MVQTFKYRSPTTPAGAGWIVDLGNQAVRLGDETGLITHAELGVVGVSSLRFDDPDGTAGHNGDAIVGLKQFSVFESDTFASKNRVWEGYIADRRYYRGSQGVSPSLRTGAARVIDMTLVDLNAFLSFRVFVPTSISSSNAFNRPAETDVARVTALLGVGFLSTTLFDNGLVSTASPVQMDAVDYTGQHAADVLNDCAQQSGKNFFVYYDEAAGQFSLFYDFNDSPVFLADIKVSNVLADVNGSNVFYPMDDAVLTRDPSRVTAGVLIQNGSNSVYQSDVATGYAFLYKDAVANSQNIKTVAQATARATRYLAENSSEDDRITWTCRLPSANVNDWYAGQAGQVKFSHLPGYENYRYVRVLQRTVKQVEKTASLYDVYFEATPMAPAPSGAFVVGSGSSTSAVPTLPSATVEGNLLFMVVVVQRPTGPTSYGEGPPTFHDVSGGAAQTWAQHGFVKVYDNTAAIGPPGPISFGIWSRRVAAGEATTTPVNVRSPGGASDQVSVWLWQIRNVGDPTDVATLAKNGDPAAGGLANGGTYSVGASLSGWVVGGFAVQMVDYGGKPTVAAVSGSTIQNCAGNNDPAVNATHGWTLPWIWIGQNSAGGAVAASWSTTFDPSYNHEGAAGMAVVIPGMTQALPNIPYPANVVGT